MVQILYVRLAPGGFSEQHITDVRWYNPETGEANVANTATMVHFIKNQGGRAYVCDGSRIVNVQVAGEGGEPYIKAVANPFQPANSLLTLPKF